MAAIIFNSINGMDFDKAIATLPGVQKFLTSEADEIGHRAKGLLAQHRDQGHARIEVESGDIDRYVILNDERGMSAAMSIEYGRGPDENGNGASPGLFILHDAATLTGKRTMPRSKRRKKYYTKKRS